MNVYGYGMRSPMMKMVIDANKNSDSNFSFFYIHFLLSEYRYSLSISFSVEIIESLLLMVGGRHEVGPVLVFVNDSVRFRKMSE